MLLELCCLTCCLVVMCVRGLFKTIFTVVLTLINFICKLGLSALPASVELLDLLMK